ncbi:MAG TPA: oligopeptide/dipeptide ABC transporter ATP-binding protein, partial [Pirellulales bacterium]
SIPRLDAVQKALTPIPGQPPDLAALPAGCYFQPRCPNAIERCAVEYPPWFPGAEGQRFACFNPFNPEPSAMASGTYNGAAPSPMAPG